MSAARKARVVLKAKKGNAPFFLAVCQAILAGITAHPNLFQPAGGALACSRRRSRPWRRAQQQAKRRIPGAAAARNPARDELFVSDPGAPGLRPGPRDGLARTGGHAGTGGRDEARRGAVRAKPILAAKQGPQSGVVYLEANATLLAGGKKKGAALLQLGSTRSTARSGSRCPPRRTRRPPSPA